MAYLVLTSYLLLTYELTSRLSSGVWLDVQPEGVL
jgi:hypothetical protein